jgi:glycosyltransferase involved in cell wall biosynthesis
MTSSPSSWGGHARRRALRLAKRIADERALRPRRPPQIHTETGGDAGIRRRSTIYYLCPDYATPSGGIRAIYRHVDILNEAGRSAAVLHRRDGYACRWFEHATRTVGAPSVRLSREDVLVVPEIYGPYLSRLPREPKLVAFNQNAYLTYEHVPSGRPPAYGIFTDAMTVSEDSAELLRFAFPGLDVTVVPNAIDTDTFHPSEQAPARRIAMMPRKRPEDSELIMRLLGDRLRGWEIVRIEGMSELQTAASLRSAPIFLALGRREGFGLPAAEAMASGCCVVGFPGFGGRELFDPAFSEPVEDGDVLSAARAVAALLDLYERDRTRVRERGARAREHIRARYSLERQRNDLLAFYARLFG